MEDMLGVYERPYSKKYPVVCMDEKPYQLFGEAREPLPTQPGSDQKLDSEYIRNGTCSIFAFIEPLGGVHHVSVREHRIATDWAEEIKFLSDIMYADAEKIVLVMDNLNVIRFLKMGKLKSLRALKKRYGICYNIWKRICCTNK